MRKQETLYGTCSWCFGDFAATDRGISVRHGWSEEGGTRTVGEYGNVFHSGSCGGVDFPPFELSPEGTYAFLTLRKQNLLSLEVREDLVRGGKEELFAEVLIGHTARTRYAFSQPQYGVVRILPRQSVLLNQTPKNLEAVATYHNVPQSERPYHLTIDERQITYATVLATTLAGLLAAQERTTADIALLSTRIVEWSLQQLSLKPKVGPVVHFLYKPKATYTACGKKTEWAQFLMTTDAQDVTCSRCKAVMEKGAAADALRDAVVVNRERLAVLLRAAEKAASDANAPGGVLTKTIKAELGIDQVMFNKIMDLDARERMQQRNLFSQDYTGQKRWRLIRR